MTSTSNFKADIWDHFNLNATLKVITSETDTFHEERALYMAALGAWIAAPSNATLRRTAISKTALQACIEIEQSGNEFSGGKNPADVIFTEAYARIGRPEVILFYHEVYHAIGGLSSIAGTYACDSIKDRFNHHFFMTDRVADVLGIYHFHAVKFRNGKDFHKPSLLKASQIASDLFGGKQRGDGAMNDRNIRKAFSECRDSAVFIYAASTIAAPPFDSLLHAIQGGAFVWNRYKDKISQLIGRAKYIQDSLIPLLYKNAGVGRPFDLSGLEQIPFKAPAYDEAQARLIQKTFGRHAKAKGRVIK